MGMKLYYFEASPPVRSVLMVINALELNNVEFLRVNLSKKEQLTEEFLTLNPTHTVPTLDDNGFIVWDSHAIVQYLADKYQKNDSLYPRKFEKRTLVNQMLFFDTSVLFPSLASAVRPVFYDDATEVPQDKIDGIESSFGYLEEFLKRSLFLADDRVTIADICALATVSTIEIFHLVDVVKYPKVAAWLAKLKKCKFYESNLDGVQNFTDMFMPLIKK